jgi:PIN domain nuclease of toxin-antitoxin system
MKYLLDSNALYYWIFESKKLSPKIMSIISSVNNEIYISVVSIFELLSKQKKGKLAQSIDFLAEIGKCNFSIAEMSLDVVKKYNDLGDFPWKDPFDHLIICTASTNRFTIITSDNQILAYAQSTGSIKAINTGEK